METFLDGLCIIVALLPPNQYDKLKMFLKTIHHTIKDK